jgi:cell division protein FtsX
MVDDSVFTQGILFGLLAAFVVGAVARQILFAMGSVRKYFAPQTVIQQTKQTPAQVGSGCLKGLGILIFWAALVVGLIAVWLSGRVRIEVL